MQYHGCGRGAWWNFRIRGKKRRPSCDLITATPGAPPKEFLLIMHFTKQLYFFINSTCHYIENSSCVLPRFPNTDMLFCHCMLDAVLDHTSCGRVLRPTSSCSACAYINYESIFDFWPYYIPDILGKWKYYELLEEWDTSDEFSFWRKYFILCQIIYQKFQKSENILSYKISEKIILSAF